MVCCLGSYNEEQVAENSKCVILWLLQGRKTGADTAEWKDSGSGPLSTGRGQRLGDSAGGWMVCFKNRPKVLAGTASLHPDMSTDC